MQNIQTFRCWKNQIKNFDTVLCNSLFLSHLWETLRLTGLKTSTPVFLSFFFFHFLCGFFCTLCPKLELLCWKFKPIPSNKPCLDYIVLSSLIDLQTTLCSWKEHQSISRSSNELSPFFFYQWYPTGKLFIITSSHRTHPLSSAVCRTFHNIPFRTNYSRVAPCWAAETFFICVWLVDWLLGCFQLCLNTWWRFINQNAVWQPRS